MNIKKLEGQSGALRPRGKDWWAFNDPGEEMDCVPAAGLGSYRALMGWTEPSGW